MIVRHPDGTVDHDGEYNPWDMTPEQRQLYQECRDSGGFVFRTGVHDLRTGRSYGDGLHFVKIVDATLSEDQEGEDNG